MRIEYGLDTIPEKCVLLLEEEAGYVKNIFAQTLASNAAKTGKRVIYITPHSREEICAQMEIYRLHYGENLEFRDRCTRTEDLFARHAGDVCIIDPFSLFYLDASITELRQALENLAALSRNGTTFLLVCEQGTLPARSEQLIRSMADGIIRFVTSLEGSRIKRFISVPKMKGYLPADKIHPFVVTGEGILIDTRERHG
jgi:KaiC/GvpD/RAD55 family RecA-like ATPase